MLQRIKPIWQWLKYPIAFAILAFVLSEADAVKILDYALDMPIYWLVAIFLLFFAAQFFAVLRMNFYYRTVGKHIGLRYSLILHYVALFYNVILPGGIGGDAYKVFLLKRVAGYPAKQGIRIQLLTRTNGLLVLMLTLYGFACFIDWPYPAMWIYGSMATLTIITLVGYFVLSNWLLKESVSIALRALPYSFAVQGLNVLVMVAIWLAMGGESHAIIYMFLFQLAAVAGMIPITIGGLGIRELTFFFGAIWLSSLTGSFINPEFGVAISLMVFAYTVLHACVGLIWLGKVGKMHPEQAIDRGEENGRITDTAS
ncbi:MAG: flippase-like domain-containing protein [Rickettsiales bacterium]|nr:flippase-like domain-containing protein [Rickettsiales bacterium]